MEKTLNKAKRRKIYLELAKWYSEQNSIETGCCLTLQSIWHGKDPNVVFYDYEWMYLKTPEYFPEYGMINPNCNSHTDNNERIIALLFAYQMTF